MSASKSGFQRAGLEDWGVVALDDGVAGELDEASIMGLFSGRPCSPEMSAKRSLIPHTWRNHGGQSADSDDERRSRSKNRGGRS